MRNFYPMFFVFLAMLMIIIARRPLDILRKRGAVSPGTAIPVDDLSPNDRRRLDRLVARGLVKEATPGRFYYDRDAERAQARRRMPYLITFIVVLAILVLALVYLRHPHVQPLP